MGDEPAGAKTIFGAIYQAPASVLCSAATPSRHLARSTDLKTLAKSAALVLSLMIAAPGYAQYNPCAGAGAGVSSSPYNPYAGVGFGAPGSRNDGPQTWGSVRLLDRIRLGIRALQRRSALSQAQPV